MNKTQEDTLNAIVKTAQATPEILAVLLCGSVAEGRETDGSDIDVIVVVNHQDWKRRKQDHELFWVLPASGHEEFTSVDGKVVGPDFLEKVFSAGDEAAQNSLLGARFIVCKDRKLFARFVKPNPPAVDKHQCSKFYAMMVNRRYTADDDTSNIFQVRSCMVDTVFFASRLVLSHNQVLFPCRKHLAKALARCEFKPGNYELLANRLLETFSFADLEVFFITMTNYFSEYAIDEQLRKSYVLEHEMHWYFETKSNYEI